MEQQLETMKSQLPAMLLDFQKYYVFLNKNPDFAEYQNMFQSVKDNLNNVNTQLFTLSNEVTSKINLLNNKLFSIDSEIDREKAINKKLKHKLNIIEHKGNASTEMLSDYQTIYETKYMHNWYLFLSILIISSSIYLKR